MKKTKLKCTAFLLLVVFNVFSQEKNLSIKSIPAELIEKANSVIRFENTVIDIKSQREMVLTYETAITILNIQADNFSDVTVPYNKRSAIKNLKINIFNANGEEIKKVKSSEIKDYSAQDGFSLFNDGRLMHYDHIPISYPYTIQYSYEIRTSNTAFIPGWILNGSYYQSVENAVFQLKYPSDIKLTKSEKNFEGFSVDKKESLGYVSYSFKNLKAMEM